MKDLQRSLPPSEKHWKVPAGKEADGSYEAPLQPPTAAVIATPVTTSRQYHDDDDDNDDNYDPLFCIAPAHPSLATIIIIITT